jgi:hypothetical protein
VHLVEHRAVRAVVLVLALGVGGVAGAPTMALPPRAGVTISGDDDTDGDDPGGGGGGPTGPMPPPAGPRERIADRHERMLVGKR